MIGYGFLTRSETVTKRGHNQILKIINQATAERQRDERLEKHFEDVPETKPGGGGYRYRGRTAAYNKRKLKKYKHQKPNVFTGELRASAIRRVKIVATTNKGVMKTRGTTKSRLSRWQAAELVAVSNRERKQERKRQAKHYGQLAKMRKYKTQRKRKVT
jgi:hypothetical protein